MADLNQPEILGYAITPWFIILCISFIGVIVSAVMILFGFSKRKVRESEMIDKAVKNTSKIPVKDIDITGLNINSFGEDGTEAITCNSETTGTAGFTDVINDKTEGLGRQTESFDFKEITEGLEAASETESFTFETSVLNSQTEGLTEFDLQESNEIEKSSSKPKFCSYCGNKVMGKGKFCSQCGHETK